MSEENKSLKDSGFCSQNEPGPVQTPVKPVRMETCEWCGKRVPHSTMHLTSGHQEWLICKECCDKRNQPVPPGPKIKLMVVMLDTWRTYLAITHENEHIPYGRRMVEIELTSEQVEKLKPRFLGRDKDNKMFEEYGPSWIEVEKPMLRVRT